MMSHEFLYHAWCERQVPEVILDFVENSVSLKSPSVGVTAHCFFIVGLMIGVPFRVNGISVEDKRLDLNFS